MHNALKPTVLDKYGDSGERFLVREYTVEDVIDGEYEVMFHDNIDTSDTKRNCQLKFLFS